MGIPIELGILNKESTDNAYIKGNIIEFDAGIESFIDKIYVSEHQYVKEGTLLAKLSTRLITFDTKIAKANIELIKQKVIKKSHELEVAKRMADLLKKRNYLAQESLSIFSFKFERSKLLRSNKIINSIVVEDKKLDFINTKKELNDINSKLEISKLLIADLTAKIIEFKTILYIKEIELQKKKYRISRSKIRATSDGYIANIHKREGSFVLRGEKLFRFIPTSPIWVEARFKETQLSKIINGQKVQISIDGYPGKSFIGTILSIGPTSSAAMSAIPLRGSAGNFTKIIQRIPVKISIKNNDISNYRLRPGMSAVVRLK
jgi:membrane fusion protein (multidrug efflux system)